MNEVRKKKTLKGKGLLCAFKKGSLYTRLSFLFMGFGHIARGQIGKGVCYMLTEAAFLLFMLFFGGGYIAHLFSGDLGSKVSGEEWNETLQIFEKIKGDNSFLILLYGVISLVVVAGFLVIWRMNIKSAYENDIAVKTGKALPAFKEDMRALFNERFYVPLLFLPF